MSTFRHGLLSSRWRSVSVEPLVPGLELGEDHSRGDQTDADELQRGEALADDDPAGGRGDQGAE